MVEEDVAGIGLASGRTAEEQGQLAVGHSLLGQIVVNNQRVLAVVAKILSHRAAGHCGNILHRRGI